jgi:hypothetical protein
MGKFIGCFLLGSLDGNVLKENVRVSGKSTGYFPDKFFFKNSMNFQKMKEFPPQFKKKNSIFEKIGIRIPRESPHHQKRINSNSTTSRTT